MLHARPSIGSKQPRGELSKIYGGIDGQIGIGTIVETPVSYQLLLLVIEREHTVQ
jgi:hypothetical protein